MNNKMKNGVALSILCLTIVSLACCAIVFHSDVNAADDTDNIVVIGDFGYIVSTDSNSVTLKEYRGSSTDIVIPVSVMIDGTSYSVDRIAKDFSFNEDTTTINLGMVDQFSIDLFTGLSSLTDIYVSADQPHYFSENGILYEVEASIFKKLLRCPEGKNVIELDLSSENIITICEGSFKNCKLEFLILPSSLFLIEDHAFEGSSLKKIDFLSHPTMIGGSIFDVESDYLEIYSSVYPYPDFSNHTTKDGLTIRNSYTSEYQKDLAFLEYGGVEYFVELDSEFASLTKYVGPETEINIPDTIEFSGKEYKINCIKDGAFESSSITSITLGGNLDAIGCRAFANCASLTGSLVIPNNVSYIGEEAFYGCSFESITIGSGLKPHCYFVYVTDDYYDKVITNPFAGVTLTDGGFIVSGNKYYSVENGLLCCTESYTDSTDEGTMAEDGASQKTVVSGHRGLTSITIPENTYRIAADAFRSCDKVGGTITIPSSVCEIEEGAFRGCGGSSLTIEGSSLYSSSGGFLIRNGENNQKVVVSCLTGYSGYDTLPDDITAVERYAFWGINLDGKTISAPLSLVSFSIETESPYAFAVSFREKEGDSGKKVSIGAECDHYYGYVGDEGQEVTSKVDESFIISWVPKTYDIIFDGLGYSTDNLRNTVEYSVAGDVLGTIGTPFKDGYAFLGWMENGSEELIINGRVSFQNPIQLTACWKDNNESVIIGKNGDFDLEYRNGESIVDLNSVDIGSCVVISGSSNDMCYRVSGSNYLEVLLDSVVPITIYSGLNVEEVCKVTYDHGFDDFIEVTFVYKGDTLQHNISRWNYSFEGWYDGETLVPLGTSIDKNMYLTARWSSEHTVTFYCDGILYAERNRITHNSVIDTMPADPTKLIDPASPESGSYSFLGWLIEGQQSMFDPSSPVMQSMNLHAVFNQPCNITVVGEGIIVTSYSDEGVSDTVQNPIIGGTTIHIDIEQKEGMVGHIIIDGVESCPGDYIVYKDMTIDGSYIPESVVPEEVTCVELSHIHNSVFLGEDVEFRLYVKANGIQTMGVSIQFPSEVFEWVDESPFAISSESAEVSLSGIDKAKNTIVLMWNDPVDLDYVVLSFFLNAKSVQSGACISVEVQETEGSPIGTASMTLDVIDGKRGDMNGDGAVNEDDAISLLFSLVYPSLYPLNQNADFNGDSRFDSRDVIHLLYHTYFSDRYPLS